jgi:hypothetical protein
LKACVFATVVTALLFGQGYFIGWWLGPWGALLSIALGFTEGNLAARWFLWRMKRCGR